MRRALQVWALLAFVACGAVMTSVATGSTHIDFADVVRLVFRNESSAASEVIHRLRLPRTMAAFATGGLLAVAGALMQVLLRNPLADPYVLGLSGGSAVGALAAMIFGLSGAFIDLGAFSGALLSMLTVFAMANRDLGWLQSASEADASPRLLLVGVVLAAGWSAIVTLMLTMASEAQLRGILFWLMGDLSGADAYAFTLAALAVLVVAIYPWSRDLNVMLRGPVLAQSLGVPVARVRRLIYFAASLATALAVTTAGTIGFVGLIVPHALRLAIGNDQRVLLPASALAGGALLVIADTLARSVLAPQQLPVGAVTAVIGVPTFMFLLLRVGRTR
ncbi:MAG: iron ABC transporter permease [Pseudomonadota bacterium]|nr:iron ABC transporter permease [Pseudomonadota bacterium]